MTGYLPAAGRWNVTSQERQYVPTKSLSTPIRDLQRLIIELLFYHQSLDLTEKRAIFLDGTGSA
jgi:hypothetical protein